MSNSQRECLILCMTAVLGVLVSSLLFYPGGMTNDSVVQYAQLKGVLDLDSWHPLIFVKTWTILSIFGDGPFPMLVFNQLLYWFGIALVVKNLFSGRIRQILIILLLGFFPVFHALMGTVWKDASLLGGCILGLGFLLEGKAEKSWKFSFLSLMMFSYVAAARHNGFLAIVPLIWMMVYRGAAWGGLFRTMIIAIGVVGFAIVLNFSTQAKKYPNLVNQVFVWDLWGMSLNQNKALIPAACFVGDEPIDLDHYRKYYNPLSNNSIIFNPNARISKTIFVESESAIELQQSFIDNVLENPSSYLLTRIEFMKGFLGSQQWHPYLAYHLDSVDPASIGLQDLPHHKMNTGVFLKWYKNVLSYFIHWNIFNLVPYIVLAMIALAIGVLRKNMLVIYLLSSGLCYWLPYFFVSPSNDFRYHSWFIFVILLGTLHLLLGKRDKTSHN